MSRWQRTSGWRSSALTLALVEERSVTVCCQADLIVLQIRAVFEGMVQAGRRGVEAAALTQRRNRLSATSHLAAQRVTPEGAGTTKPLAKETYEDSSPSSVERGHFARFGMQSASPTPGSDAHQVASWAGWRRELTSEGFNGV